MSRRRVVVVSPHFDDVPLSLGQSLTDGVLSRCTVEVHVAFARTNWTRWFHPTAARARLVGALRRGEELVASVRFRYRWRTGRWSESLLRTGDDDPSSFLDPDSDLSAEPLVDELAAWIGELVAQRRDGRRPDLLLVCGGLGGHVDHRIVAAAGRLVGEAGQVAVGYYEDRPYTAYLEDAELRRQLDLGPGAEAVEVSGPIESRTQRAVRRCYPSQIDGYFVEAMQRDRVERARERVWFPEGARPDWL